MNIQETDTRDLYITFVRLHSTVRKIYIYIIWYSKYISLSTKNHLLLCFLLFFKGEQIDRKLGLDTFVLVRAVYNRFIELFRSYIERHNSSTKSQ